MHNDGPFKKGIFIPIHPEKNVGKRIVIARSSWEYKFLRFLDSNPNVLEWASESLIIPYLNPVTGRVTRYYPDFLIKYKDITGKEVVEIVEIKPFAQTQPPKVTKGKHKRTLLMEAKAYAINSSKWAACNEYCKIRGIKFRIITEKELHIR